MGTQTGVAAMMPGEGWLCLGLLAAVLWLFQKAKRLFWAFSLLVLPGTFCHEVCHYATALVLNGRPVAFSVFPRREPDRIRLGAVMFANLRWYNAFFIGLAPLALLAGAWALLRWILAQRLPFGLPLVLLVLLVANLAYGALPSRQDVRVAAGSPVGWVLLGLGLAWGWSQVRTEGIPRVPGASRLEWRWAGAERALVRGARRVERFLIRQMGEGEQRLQAARH